MPSFSFAGALWLPALLFTVCGAPGPASQEILTLEVAPRTVECTGEAPQRCLLVREGADDEWTAFYDRIEGFTYEEGFHYRIRVQRRRIPNPAADASSFEHRLLEVVSQTPADPG